MASRVVNVLLYGPPGTGKTEFCKVLAQRLGVTLYSAGESDEDGDEPTRDERLKELRLAQRLLAGQRKSLILFDESEDLLSEGFAGLSLFGRSFGSGTRGSKVYLHRLLEETPAPTLWTVNDAGQVSNTILRRFMFAFELRLPTTEVRQRIWARQLEINGIEAASGRRAPVGRDVRSHSRRGRRRHRRRSPGRRRHGRGAAVGCAACLAYWDATGRLRRRQNGLTLPLFAPTSIRPPWQIVSQAAANAVSPSACKVRPGTGKSALVRYLAQRLGLEVVQKRASDLLVEMGGRYGETTSRMPSPKRATAALSWSSTRPTPFSPTGAFAERNMGGFAGQRNADLDG